ncbi:DNA-binding response regulator, partial [bacterium 1xD42-87]
MNIAVVDDEEAIREQISGFIKKRNPDFNISG